MQPYSFSPIAAIYFSSETDVPDNQLFQVPILGLGNKKKKNLSQSFGFKLFAKRGAYKKKNNNFLNSNEILKISFLASICYTITEFLDMSCPQNHFLLLCHQYAKLCEFRFIKDI